MSDSNAPFGQAKYQVRFDWGAAGAERVLPGAHVVVVVDVLSFTTTCTPGRMRSAPAAPQSNRTWYFAWPKGALESLTATG